MQFNCRKQINNVLLQININKKEYDTRIRNYRN